MSLSADNLRRIEVSGLLHAADYVARYQDVPATGLLAAEHYLLVGARLLRDPGPGFSTRFYLQAYPDVAGSGMNPLLHYIRFGRAERRCPTAAVARRRARASYPQKTFDRVKAAFDADFYLRMYGDRIPPELEPVEHYLAIGTRAGLDPTPDFSTSYYLRHAPDVRDAHINPFVHYVLHGKAEKRAALPFRQRLARERYRPRVSVIVPNYNHARFLPQRLDSILDQTYGDLEVIVLDDCSTDDSRSVIADYCRRHGDRVRAIFNETNSGNVFRQWRKGVEQATGDLVWICESDDFCEPDFLEHLVGAFKDHSVNIAFGRIQFADREGNPRAGLDAYREGAEPGIWADTLTRPANAWFAGAFGVNNVIANVGGCVWRRQSLSDSTWRQAESFSVLGDWFLYCHLAGGGQITYEPRAVAYFRQHGDNTSVTSFTTPPYYAEHQRLMLLLRSRWNVPAATVEKFHAKVAFQYRHNALAERHGALSQYVNVQDLLACGRSQPHVLIAFLGFHSGGGEIFPIHLANALRRSGVVVSMLALSLETINPGVLAELDPAIAVYDATYVEEVGLDAFLEAAGVSIVHSHMLSLDIFFFERCESQAEIPYLVTLHGSYEACDVSVERLDRLSTHVTHWVYTAERNLDVFPPDLIAPGRFTKMGNGMPLDTRPFPKTRADLGIAEDAVVFTLVARGILRKGWRASIAAFAKLRKARPDLKVHLLLCGDGEIASRLAVEHADDPDITFLGFQDRINGLYALSDCALVPTRFAGESFPLCVIQAMQMGVPIISTKLGEIQRMVLPPGSAAGILIEPVRDTESFTGKLAAAMEAMLDRDVRAHFGAAAKNNSKPYDIDRVASDYVSLYRSLIDGNGDAAATQVHRARRGEPLSGHPLGATRSGT